MTDETPPPPSQGPAGEPSYLPPPPAYQPAPPAYQPPASPYQPSYDPGYNSPVPPGYTGPPVTLGGGYGVPPPPPGYQSARTGWSGLAIAAFVTSLLPLIGILAAVPLAIVALVKISKSAMKGKGLAIAAIAIAALWWVAFISVAVWWAGQSVQRNAAGEITNGGRIGFGEIRMGDCLRIPDPGGSGDVNTFAVNGVPCTENHNAEAAAILPIAAKSYPGSGALDARTVGTCRLRAQRYLAGRSPSGLQPYRLIPTESIWNGTNGHRVLCFITRTDYTDMRGSLAG